jgi:hypothetical protein
MRSEQRRLTDAEFKAGLRKNRANPSNPVMILARASPGGNRRRAKKNPFFQKAFDSFVSGAKAPEADSVAEDLLTAHIDFESVIFRKVAGLNPQNARLRKSIKLRLPL